MRFTHMCCLGYEGGEKLNFFLGKVTRTTVDQQSGECEIVPALCILWCV